jgi:hypothetical protein
MRTTTLIAGVLALAVTGAVLFALGDHSTPRAAMATVVPTASAGSVSLKDSINAPRNQPIVTLDTVVVHPSAAELRAASL